MNLHSSTTLKCWLRVTFSRSELAGFFFLKSLNEFGILRSAVLQLSSLSWPVPFHSIRLVDRLIRRGVIWYLFFYWLLNSFQTHHSIKSVTGIMMIVQWICSNVYILIRNRARQIIRCHIKKQKCFHWLTYSERCVCVTIDNLILFIICFFLLYFFCWKWIFMISSSVFFLHCKTADTFCVNATIQCVFIRSVQKN